MRTKIQSDNTRVPPVTDEKSPPDSRITGADSPVMALSSTDATPAITWPSPGMVSPASTSTTSPRRSSPEGWLTAWPRHASGVAWLASASLNPLSRRAAMVVRRPRKVAACCLPRPSARASAKLANSTVNQSHTVIARMKPAGASAWPRSAMIHRIVVRMLPA